MTSIALHSWRVHTVGAMFADSVSPLHDEGAGGQGEAGLGGPGHASHGDNSLPLNHPHICDSSILHCGRYDIKITTLFSQSFPGAFVLVLLYRMFYGDKVNNICSILSSVSLLLTKHQVAQQLNNMDNSAQETFLSLSNVFTNNSSDFVEKVLGSTLLVNHCDFLN